MRLIAFVALRTFGHLAELVLDQEFEVAAQFDVGAAAGHVGRDGHRAHAAGLRDDMRFALVEAGIQDRVRDAFLLEIFRQHLRFFDRHGADQDRLAGFLPRLDLLGDGARTCR